jgi:hypothetical protein
VVELIAAVITVSTGAGSLAGPFAYADVLVMLMIAIPITIIVNAMIIPGANAPRPHDFHRRVVLSAGLS